jgi:hypothetical protein
MKKIIVGLLWLPVAGLIATACGSSPSPNHPAAAPQQQPSPTASPAPTQAPASPAPAQTPQGSNSGQPGGCLQTGSCSSSDMEALANSIGITNPDGMNGCLVAGNCSPSQQAGIYDDYFGGNAGSPPQSGSGSVPAPPPPAPPVNNGAPDQSLVSQVATTEANDLANAGANEFDYTGPGSVTVTVTCGEFGPGDLIQGETANCTASDGVGDNGSGTVTLFKQYAEDDGFSWTGPYVTDPSGSYDSPASQVSG